MTQKLFIKLIEDEKKLIKFCIQQVLTGSIKAKEQFNKLKKMELEVLEE